MGEIKGVTSGTGFSGVFADEIAIGDAGVAGHKYKPISRWTEFPFQLYREGDTEQPLLEGTSDPDHLYFGIMAYHAEGIKEVEFFLNGGDGVKVTEQEINPYTNLPEYCVRLNKADIINPKDSDETSNNEFTNNMELRAIVRPNSGIPRIHQHDKDVVLGEDMSLLTGYYVGFSGGKGDHFFDKKSVPGEFSMIGTIAKSKSDTTSVLDSITVYMRPDGDDDNVGTKEFPVKTTGKALAVIRDLAAEVPNRLITEDDTGSHYVDVSRSEIVLLKGIYDKDNFGEAESVDVPGADQVGWPSERVGGEFVDQTNSDNRRPLCKNGWFIVKGDPDENREDIELTLTDEQALLGESLPRQEHSSDFSLLSKNPTLNCFKFEHLFINRKQTTIATTSWGFRFKAQAGPFVAGHTAESDLGWFHDVTIKSDSVAGIHSKGSFLKNERMADQCVFVSGSAKHRSKILGGEQISIAFVNLINTDIRKVDGDNFKQYSLVVGNTIKGNNNAFATIRRLWFNPASPGSDDGRADTSPYAKFNGYYVAIRLIGAEDESRPGADENGSPFFNPGTLREYLRIHNLNTPEGVTLSWPKNPSKAVQPQNTSNNPNVSGDDSANGSNGKPLGEITGTGTIWQKINHTNMLDLNLPWQSEPADEDTFTLTTFREWGDRFRTDNNPAHTASGDNYFGSTAEKEPPVLSTLIFPTAPRHQSIGPEKKVPFWFTEKTPQRLITQQKPYNYTATDDMTVADTVDLTKEAVGESIYDPKGELNSYTDRVTGLPVENKLYEPIFCTMLKYEDSTVTPTITAWGQFVFDARKPLVANPDWQEGELDTNGVDWGITQDYVFRLAGTTWPAAGLMEPVPIVENGAIIGHKAPKMNTGWPYTKAQYQPSPDPKKDRGQYEVAWAAGITTQGLSAEHRGTATYAQFVNQNSDGNAVPNIFPQNTHPIQSRSNLGARDTTHVDTSQIHATTKVDSIHTPENILVAYNETSLDGQQGQHSGGSQYMGSYICFAYVNNVWANLPLPNSIAGFNLFPPGTQHMLWYHNTMHNVIMNTVVGPLGENKQRQWTFGEDVLEGDQATYLKTQYPNQAPNGGGLNGEPGFTLDDFYDAIVFRNNFITKFTDAKKSDDENWIEQGLGIGEYENVDPPLPYINPTTSPLRIERNFKWNGGPIGGNEEAELDHMIVLPIDNPPLWKAMFPYAGGAADPFGIKSPYDLISVYQPADASPLKGGGTLGMEDQVPFDLNRKRRIGHSTVGAYEVDSSYITANNEYVAQTSNNSSTNGDELFPSLSDGSTLMPFSVSFDKHEDLYGKRIKVRATKVVGGEVEERFSTNIMRLQRSKDGDGGPEGQNTEGRAFLRSFLGDPPNDPFTETYLFTSNQSVSNPYVIYGSPSSDDFTLAEGETSGYGEDLEFETIQTSSSRNQTWLLTSYDISTIQIFGSNFQSVPGDRNKIRLSFDRTLGDTRGTTLASYFYDSYIAAGDTIGIPFGNGTTFFVDKIAGGMTAHGSSVESYFFVDTPGTTVSLPTSLPIGDVLIEKPTGL